MRSPPRGGVRNRNVAAGAIQLVQGGRHCQARNSGSLNGIEHGTDPPDAPATKPRTKTVNDRSPAATPFLGPRPAVPRRSRGRQRARLGRAPYQHPEPSTSRDDLGWPSPDSPLANMLSRNTLRNFRGGGKSRGGHGRHAINLSRISTRRGGIARNPCSGERDVESRPLTAPITKARWSSAWPARDVGIPRARTSCNRSLRGPGGLTGLFQPISLSILIIGVRAASEHGFGNPVQPQGERAAPWPPCSSSKGPTRVGGSS